MQVQVLGTFTENCFAFLEFFKGKAWAGVSNRYLLYARCSAVSDDGSIIACARSLDAELLPSLQQALKTYNSSTKAHRTTEAVQATLMLGGMVFKPLPPAADGRSLPSPPLPALSSPQPPPLPPQPPHRGQLRGQR